MEIPIKEYCKIIRDVSNYDVPLLVGEEYLDVSSLKTIYKDRPEIKIKNHNVNWLTNNPSWPVSAVNRHIIRIKSLAEEMGLNYFDSDLDLMEWLILINYKATVQHHIYV